MTEESNTTRPSRAENSKQEDRKGRRVTVDLTAAAAKEVDRLRALTELSTAELFRHALSLIRIYVEARQRGLHVCLQDPKTGDVTTQIVLPMILSSQTDE